MAATPSRYFPVFLDLAGQRCSVIDGGAVAERKVAGLLDVGAVVTVVAPAITTGVDAWRRAGRVTHVARRYERGDLASQRLAFVATDDRDVSAAVADEGRALGVWVNAADDPPHSDFILPSVLRRGPLAVAVGTSGASPVVARIVREELEAYFGEDYGALVDVASEVREALRHRGRSSSGAAWVRALDEEVRGLVRHGHGAEACERLLARLEAESTSGPGSPAEAESCA